MRNGEWNWTDLPLKPIGMALAVAAELLIPLWVWYGWRIEPANGQIAILLKKTGKVLAPEAILAPGP